MSENFAEMLANEEWKEIHTGEVVYIGISSCMEIF